MNQKRNFSLYLLMAVSLLGTTVLLVATSRWGIGFTGDSVRYLGTARSLLSGDGFNFMKSGRLVASVRWPPLLPILIAGLGSLGIEFAEGARWLNAFLFGANILMAGGMVKKETGSMWLSLLASFFVLTSQTMIMTHAMLWSEPLYIFFSLLGIYGLAVYLSQPEKPWWLILSASSIGAAILTRYLGLSLVGAGILSLLFLSQTSWRKRISDGFLFGVLSFAGVSLWLFRNFLIAHDVWDRSLGFRAYKIWDEALQALVLVSRWVIPSHFIPSSVAMIAFLVTMIVLGIVSAALVRNKESSRFRLTLQLYVLCFFLALLVHIVFFASGFQINGRILSPLFIPFLVLVLLAIRPLFFKLREQGLPKPLFLLTGLFVLYAGYYGQYGVQSYASIFRDGQGYTAREWRESEIIRRINALPRETLIYTNNPEPIYFLTGRTAFHLPAKLHDAKSHPKGLKPNPGYPLALEDMYQRLRREGGVIVYFKQFPSFRYPSAEELQQGNRAIELVEKARGGEIYKLKGDLSS